MLELFFLVSFALAADNPQQSTVGAFSTLKECEDTRAQVEALMAPHKERMRAERRVILCAQVVDPFGERAVGGS